MPQPGPDEVEVVLHGLTGQPWLNGAVGVVRPCDAARLREVLSRGNGAERVTVVVDGEAAPKLIRGRCLSLLAPTAGSVGRCVRVHVLCFFLSPSERRCGVEYHWRISKKVKIIIVLCFYTLSTVKF